MPPSPVQEKSPLRAEGGLCVMNYAFGRPMVAPTALIVRTTDGRPYGIDCSDDRWSPLRFCISNSEFLISNSPFVQPMVAPTALIVWTTDGRPYGFALEQSVTATTILNSNDRSHPIRLYLPDFGIWNKSAKDREKDFGFFLIIR